MMTMRSGISYGSNVIVIELPAFYEPEPVPAPAPDAQPSTFNLADLERLVEELSAENSDAASELEAYIEALAPYVENDGRVPDEFTPLLDATFGDLLDERLKRDFG